MPARDTETVSMSQKGFGDPMRLTKTVEVEVTYDVEGPELYKLLNALPPLDKIGALNALTNKVTKTELEMVAELMPEQCNILARALEVIAECLKN